MKKFSKILPQIIFFTFSVFFIEIWVRITNSSIDFFDIGLVRSFLADAATGCILFLICTLIRKKKISRIIAAVVLLFFGLYASVELCVRDHFGVYFQVSYIATMSGQIVGNFLTDMLNVIWNHLWVMPFTFAPGILVIIFRKKLIPELAVSHHHHHHSRTHHENKINLIFISAVSAFFLACALVSCYIGSDHNYYTYDFSSNTAIARYGMVNSIRLEVEYGIFGTPIITTDGTSDKEIQEQIEIQSKNSDDYNITDIDFDELKSDTTSSVLAQMDNYFSKQLATEKNEYTGMFEGKNLIFITAESFSGATIDKDLTPVLYALTHDGFVFNNYYQPDWSQSTSGGEFANLFGIIPTWVDGSTAFLKSADNYYPYSIANMLNEEGYISIAWHDGDYQYYNRNIVLPNIGFEFYALGNGLELPETGSLWPQSDLEMFQQTLPKLIESSLETGTPFNTYYMTISGHGPYTWEENGISQMHRDEAEDLTGIEYTDAYLATIIELEDALEYMMETLIEAGLLDDTVIVLSADHYPYFLTQDMDQDYYTYITGNDFTMNEVLRFKNSLIIYNSEMEEPIEVDAPCYSCDILPTLLNLFGLEYDSRLLSGNDILAPDVEVGEVSSNMHIACFADIGHGYSWVTAAGTYDSLNDTFHPNEGVEVSYEYVEEVTDLVSEKCTYANYVVKYDYFSHVFKEK